MFPQGRPFFTVAIPHFKYRRHLEIVLESLFQQDHERFEILISDDASPDDSNAVIPGVLAKSGRQFRYIAQDQNLGYDGNVRFCLDQARGEYVLLLGNDDALKDERTLTSIEEQLRALGLPEVAFTNYEDWHTGAVVRRALRTQVLGKGPEVALRFFRSFSFVSGLLYNRDLAVANETDRWDRSIYYQVWLACRLIAAGGRLAALDVPAIRKDVRAEGKSVVNYVAKWSNAEWSFKPRHTGLESVIRVTADAVAPYLTKAERSGALRRILLPILSVTYPYWLFEYRRVANWSFSVGIARSLVPSDLLREHELAFADRLLVWSTYGLATIGGLSIPVVLFDSLGARVANAIRRIQQSAKA